jgi:TrmH family RNA methyltransferase
MAAGNKIRSICSGAASRGILSANRLYTPFGIVMGTEAEGLSDFWLKNATKRIKIPMRGKSIHLMSRLSTAGLLSKLCGKEGFNCLQYHGMTF